MKPVENKVTTESTVQENSPKRRRRHWYDHEKLVIINSYDKGELYPAKGKPNCVIDPKSNEILSLFLIEGWRDQFRGLGLIKSEKKKDPVKLSPQTLDKEESSMQNLLVKVLMENEQLKQALYAAKISDSKKESSKQVIY